VVYSFVTTELKRLLDKLATPWQGYGFDSAVSPLAMYFQKHAQYGGRSVAADFIKVRSDKCLVVPTRLTANDGAEATLAFNVLAASSDGIVAPFIVTNNTASPAIAAVVDQLWTAGPLKINTANLDDTIYQHVEGIDIDFGIDAFSAGGAGLLYDHYLGVRQARPSIVVRLGDSKVISTVGLGGVAVTADATVFLTKLATGAAGRVAYGTLQHIGFTVTGGLVELDSAGVAGQEQGKTAIRITPAYDGTDPIVAINTAMAIS
jgi:hypothetical protein